MCLTGRFRQNASHKFCVVLRKIRPKQYAILWHRCYALPKSNTIYRIFISHITFEILMIFQMQRYKKDSNQ